MTPLFLGGADPERVCELRAPSIKHQLRFWFRFLEGARQGGDWKSVLRRENEIFGSSETGRSSFSIRVKGPRPKRPHERADYRELPIEIGYLGYGPIQLRKLSAAEKAGRKGSAFEPKRPYIDVNEEIVLRLTFDRDLPAASRRAVLEALWLWCHLGGLGSRSRRGWGSMELVSVLDGLPPTIVNASGKDLAEEIRTQIGAWAPRTAQSRPTFCHWHPNFVTNISRVPSQSTEWRDPARWLGKKLLDFRSNSNFHHHSDPRLQNPQARSCWDDHELIRRYLDPRSTVHKDPTSAPSRVIFGLPQNYTFRPQTLPQSPNKATVIAQLDDDEIDRRASPLLVHYHRLANDSIAIMLTAVEMDFLPDNAKVLFKADYGHGRYGQPVLVNQPSGYRVLHDFLATL